MRKAITILSVIVIIAATALLYLTDREKSRSVDTTADISNNPIYNNYNFNESDKLIYLGTQPLYLPTGVITEAMKHDTILIEELSSLGMKIIYYPFLKGNDVNIFIQRGKLDAGIVMRALSFQAGKLY